MGRRESSPGGRSTAIDDGKQERDGVKGKMRTSRCEDDGGASRALAVALFGRGKRLDYSIPNVPTPKKNELAAAVDGW